MEKRKILSAALAAALTAGSVSVAASAVEDNVHWTDENGTVWVGKYDVTEDSKYSITLDKETVDGKEMAKITLSGLPAEFLTFAEKYEFNHDYFSTEGDGGSRERKLVGEYITVDVTDTTAFEFKRSNDDNSLQFITGRVTPGIVGEAYIDENGERKTGPSYKGEYPQYIRQFSDDFKAVINKKGNKTLEFSGYVDLDNEYLVKLAEKDSTTVMTYAFLHEQGGGYNSAVNAFDFVNFASDGKVRESFKRHSKDCLRKETVKITNNLAQSLEPGATGTSTVYTPTVSADGASAETKKILEGITVTDKNGAFDKDVVMNVTVGEVTDTSFKFGITFTKDGKEVQPSGFVTVSVPAPEFLKNGTIYVYHYDKDGNRTLLKSKVKDGFVVFDTDSFSDFELSSKELKTDGNPNTGIALAIAPVILAGAAVVVLKKKR